jgi:hypothetical protein
MRTFFTTAVVAMLMALVLVLGLNGAFGAEPTTTLGTYHPTPAPGSPGPSKMIEAETTTLYPDGRIMYCTQTPVPVCR